MPEGVIVVFLACDNSTFHRSQRLLRACLQQEAAATPDMRIRGIILALWSFPFFGTMVGAWGETSSVVGVTKPGGSSTRRLWQPVQEYLTILTPAGTGRQSREHTVNPFLSYTHLGTDFGFVGPGQAGIGWIPGTVWAQLPDDPSGWAGIWHSLARLARLPGEVLDFERPFAPWIEARYQPRIVGVRVEVAGRGNVKMEIKGPAQEVLWDRSFRVDSAETGVLASEVDPAALRRAKLLNWVAEPGADLRIDALGLEVEVPPLAFAEWVFVSSYAKAARCYSPATGFLRDRAHTEDGAFDSVPATGLFLLATAAAADRGVVEKEAAVTMLRKSWAAVSGLSGPLGLLPHFSRHTVGGFAIHPGTEYSTVDTAIFYFSALLASALLGDEAVEAAVVDAMRSIDFGPLRDADGYVCHGMADDGLTRIPYIWRDWGGETALVLLLQRVASLGALTPRMAATGRVHQGTGFIAEIQSLCFPDFDQSRPDAVSGVDWLESRRRLLADQKAYFPGVQAPDGFARRHGLYGLSAGEGAFGIGYHVGGVDLPGQGLLHPHYVLMSAALEPDPTRPLAVLEQMEALDLFPPWGMVENLFADGTGSLPLQAGLNATFEAVGAYHLLARVEGKPNAIHRASESQPVIREALSLFYPQPLR
jgi:hypothetical protein